MKARIFFTSPFSYVFKVPLQLVQIRSCQRVLGKLKEDADTSFDWNNFFLSLVKKESFPIFGFP
jgi:hypothetical protein